MSHCTYIYLTIAKLTTVIFSCFTDIIAVEEEDFKSSPTYEMAAINVENVKELHKLKRDNIMETHKLELKIKKEIHELDIKMKTELHNLEIKIKKTQLKIMERKLQQIDSNIAKKNN